MDDIEFSAINGKTRRTLRTVGKQAPLHTMVYVLFLFLQLFSFSLERYLWFVCSTGKRSLELLSMIQEFPVSLFQRK